MRLIDAYSAKEALEYSLVGDAASMAERVIDRQPTVGAVPVVRCRECKYRFKNNGHSKDGCPIIDTNIWMDDNDFCSHGEREEGAD